MERRARSGAGNIEPDATRVLTLTRGRVSFSDDGLAAASVGTAF
jgi:hypothetical protein